MICGSQNTRVRVQGVAVNRFDVSRIVVVLRDGAAIPRDGKLDTLRNGETTSHDDERQIYCQSTLGSGPPLSAVVNSYDRRMPMSGRQDIIKRKFT